MVETRRKAREIALQSSGVVFDMGSASVSDIGPGCLQADGRGKIRPEINIKASTPHQYVFGAIRSQPGSRR